MKKLQGNIWIKSAAMLLAVIFGSVAAFCGLAMLMFGTESSLRESEVNIEQQLDEQLLETYAAVLFENISDEDGAVAGAEALEGGNIRYTLIRRKVKADGTLLAEEQVYSNDPSVDGGHCLVALSSDRYFYYDANSFLDALTGTRSNYRVGEWGGTGEEKVLQTYTVYLSPGRLWNDTEGVKLPEGGTLQCGLRDYTVDAARLAGQICDFRRTCGYWLAASGILFLICFVFLMSASGHRTEDDGIHLRWTDRVAFGIYFFAAICLLFALGAIIAGALEGVGYGNVGAEFALGTAVFSAALCILVCLCFCMGVAARIKAKKFWRYTVLYYIGRPLVVLWRTVKSDWSLAAKGVLFFCAVLFVELWIVGNQLFWAFFLYKLVECPVFVYILCQMSSLKKGGLRIASGNYSEPIDTKGMLWEFKRHGENLNSVGSGISSAVEERIKSERFRTELITNVSHDIKTPLTSIINYVDLMKKQKIEDETLLEYMAVLDRQSARLKKLIEDLMEASKASTGNLPVNLEVCDAGVMLSQAVGEFGDRADAKELELIVTKPEAPALIMADGRHLWRILDNLMSNICKYTMPGTRVYIDLEVFHGMVIMTFRNISVSRLNISSEELMERFVRGDSSRNTEGSGLGLSIAQSLAALMNGNMALQIDGDLFKAIVSFEEYKK